MEKTDLHELRKDPLLGRWVAVLNQSKTPSEYVLFHEDNSEKDCFFREEAVVSFTLAMGKNWAS